MGVIPAKRGSGVTLHAFVMSKCPFCRDIEPRLLELESRFGDELTVQIDFVGGIAPDGSLSSMHGPEEIEGDLLEVCALRNTPRGLDFMVCQNETDKSFKDFSSCARRLGIDEGKLAACAHGPEGQRLLAASFELSMKKKVSATPTILIDDAPFEGARRTLSMARAVCAARPGAAAPRACATVPPVPELHISLIGDKRCAECDVEDVEKSLSRMFEGTVFKHLEYGTPQGKALYDRFGGLELPMVVFDETLDTAEEVPPSLLLAAKVSGKLRAISAGEWDPRCKDDKGCDLDACKLTEACRKEQPKRIELFAMSHCPYGARAILSLQEILADAKKKGDKLDVSIFYIGEGTKETGFSSMRGKPEVDDDLRDVCAMKHYPKGYRFMDYLACRAKDPRDPDWESCAKQTGLDPKKIQTCAEGDEGKTLLEKSFAYSTASKKTACPSWFVNGRFSFKGMSVEAIRGNLCDHEKRLKICADVVD